MGNSARSVITCRCSESSQKYPESKNAWIVAQKQTPPEVANIRKKHRRAFIRRLDTEVLDWECQENVLDKTSQTVRWIHSKVRDNFMFVKLSEQQKLAVISRMVLLDVEEGTDIISSDVECAAGDLFYLVAEGRFEVIVNLGKKQDDRNDDAGVSASCFADQQDVKVVEYTQGQCFGDLNNSTLTGVTITATCASKVWAVRLRRALKEATKRSEAEKVSLLKNVEAFRELSKMDFLMLVSAFSERRYKPMDIVAQTGQKVKKLCVIKSGVAVVSGGKLEPVSSSSLDYDDEFLEERKVQLETSPLSPRVLGISSRTVEELNLNGKDLIDQPVVEPVEAAKKILMQGLQPCSENTLTAGKYFGAQQGKHTHLIRAGENEPLIILEISHENFLELISKRKNMDMPTPKSRSQPIHRTLPSTKTPLSQLIHIGMLGQGAFGRVSLVWDEFKGQSYALKALSKYEIWKRKQVKHLQAELSVMLLMDNPFLVLLKNTYQDEHNVYFLLEACLGGELFTVLRKRRYFNEDTARFYIACVVEAFDYLHNELHIAYRDLKPENLVLDSDGYLKVTDFGFAKVLNGKTFTLCGTPDYLAPEIVTGQGHDRAVDWWTMGILLYEMLSSFPPFFAERSIDIYRKIIVGRFKFPRYIGRRAKTLILSFLRSLPEKRLGYLGTHSVNKIRQHEFFEGFSWIFLRQRRIKAPIHPRVKNKTDASNFLYRGDMRQKRRKVPKELHTRLRNF